MFCGVLGDLDVSVRGASGDSDENSLGYRLQPKPEILLDFDSVFRLARWRDV